MDAHTTFRRTITVMALALAVGAVVVPSAAANGDDGDRATSKPVVVSAAPEGFGSMGDRATSKSVYGPVDTWYRYAVSASAPASAPEGFGSMGDRATSKSVYGPVDNWYGYAVSRGKPALVSTIGPGLQIAPSDGFSWTGFAIGAAAMLGAFALLGAVGLGLRGARSGHTLRST
jgi:hypothetical protein